MSEHSKLITNLKAFSRGDWSSDTVSGITLEAAIVVDQLERFKEYVHQRLDDAGIPTHPDGPHSAKGCRIGDRLDIALGDKK